MNTFTLIHQDGCGKPAMLVEAKEKPQRTTHILETIDHWYHVDGTPYIRDASGHYPGCDSCGQPFLLDADWLVEI